MTEAATPPATVADVIRAMRHAGSAAADTTVPAAQVAAWGATLMELLYGPQKPVRIEGRQRHSAQTWMKVGNDEPFRSNKRQMEYRALYVHPLVVKPAKDHRWDADRVRCLDCQEPFDYHGPDCRTDYVAPDHRITEAIRLTWFKEPLEKLHRAADSFSHFDRQKWKRETSYLLERIAQYEKESRP